MAKETQASGKLVNAKFLAQAWGLTVDRVYQLQRQGIIRKAEKNLYSFLNKTDSISNIFDATERARIIVLRQTKKNARRWMRISVTKSQKRKHKRWS